MTGPAIGILFPALLAAGSALTVIGLLLFGRACFGVRIPGGPRCRRCRYDVQARGSSSGGATQHPAPVCPECGADLGPRSAIVFETTAPRRPRLLLGLGLGLAGLVIVVLTFRARATGALTSGAGGRLAPIPASGPIPADRLATMSAAEFAARPAQQLLESVENAADASAFWPEVFQRWRGGELDVAALVGRLAALETSLDERAPAERMTVRTAMREAFPLIAGAPPRLTDAVLWLAVEPPGIESWPRARAGGRIELSRAFSAMRGPGSRVRILSLRLVGEGVDIALVPESVRFPRRPGDSAERADGPVEFGSAPLSVPLPDSVPAGTHELVMEIEQIASPRTLAPAPGGIVSPGIPLREPRSAGVGEAPADPGARSRRRTIRRALHIVGEGEPLVPLVSDPAAVAEITAFARRCAVRVDPAGREATRFEVMTPGGAAFAVADRHAVWSIVCRIGDEEVPLRSEYTRPNGRSISRRTRTIPTDRLPSPLPDTVRLEIRPAPEHIERFGAVGAPSLLGDTIAVDVPLHVFDAAGALVR